MCASSYGTPPRLVEKKQKTKKPAAGDSWKRALPRRRVHKQQCCDFNFSSGFAYRRFITYVVRREQKRGLFIYPLLCLSLPCGRACFTRCRMLIIRRRYQGARHPPKKTTHDSLLAALSVVKTPVHLVRVIASISLWGGQSLTVVQSSSG